VNGSLETSRIGFAPFAARSRTHWRTFARYCACVGVHGIGTDAPKSSFITIDGVSHSSVATAKSNSRFARSGSSAGLAGADGVPTRLFRYMSQ
jgi:hypothetical protein